MCHIHRRRPGEGRDPYAAAAVVNGTRRSSIAQQAAFVVMDPGLRRDDEADSSRGRAKPIILRSREAASRRIDGHHGPCILRDALRAPPATKATPLRGDDGIDMCTHPHSRDMFVRVLLFVSPLFNQRAQGKPGADRTHGSGANKKHRRSDHRCNREHPGFPCAMVLRLIRARPGETGLVCHRPSRERLRVPLGDTCR
ncbi:hypothetical protein ACVIW0_003338 [Bradyrhizobium sp. USDA 4454]